MPFKPVILFIKRLGNYGDDIYFHELKNYCTSNKMILYQDFIADNRETLVEGGIPLLEQTKIKDLFEWLDKNPEKKISAVVVHSLDQVSENKKEIRSFRKKLASTPRRKSFPGYK